MRPEALLKVGGDAYITLGRDGTALEKIDILHNCPPSPRLRGTPFAFGGCRIPTYRGGKCWLATRSSGGI